MLRASVTGRPRCWTGVIRDGRKVVWSCGHQHPNRDQQSMTNGRPAYECSNMVLFAVEHRDDAMRRLAAMERSYPHLYAREHHAHVEKSRRALEIADSIRAALIAGSAG